MLKMDLIQVIRWKYYQGRLSQRQIAKEMGCSRNTVKKKCRSRPPVPR